MNQDKCFVELYQDSNWHKVNNPFGDSICLKDCGSFLHVNGKYKLDWIVEDYAGINGNKGCTLSLLYLNPTECCWVKFKSIPIEIPDYYRDISPYRAFIETMESGFSLALTSPDVKTRYMAEVIYKLCKEFEERL